MRDPYAVRKLLVGATSFMAALSIAAPAYADATDVTAARASYKAAVNAATKAHKIAVAKANREYQEALKMAPEMVAVANAQAKALAEQATRASQAKNAFDQAIATAGSDAKAQDKAARDYTMQLRKIRMDTEKALKDARALTLGKSTREQAKMLRDQAIKSANEIFKAAVEAARAKLNAVLVANGFPTEKG